MDDMIKIVARIGRSGTKIHPAFATKTPRGYVGLLFVCGCTGTANGSAANRAQIVGEGWELRTCCAAQRDGGAS